MYRSVCGSKNAAQIGESFVFCGTMTNGSTRISGRRRFLAFFWWWYLFVIVNLASRCSGQTPDGPKSFRDGQDLFQKGQYEDAAPALWNAVIFHGQTPPSRTYDVNKAFQMFIQCYSLQGKLVEGFAFVAMESFRRGQKEMGQNYLQQALDTDPDNEAVKEVQMLFGHVKESSTNERNPPKQDPNKDLEGLSPEKLYEMGSKHFAERNYEKCADAFEISCQRSNRELAPSCASAVYCRLLVVDYGFNGTQYDRDMKRLTTLVKQETAQWRTGNETHFAWQRASSTHPHMMLGYTVDSMLKRYVAEAVAFLDETMARAAEGGTSLRPLPDDMPLVTTPEQVRQENPQRIRVGFVGSGFNSKAVLYLSQDMFRFFDAATFEIHVFSFGPPDNPMFIKRGMRGVDWRERVKGNVDHFHDMQPMKDDHIKAARHIHQQGIHILIEWDGYARQGERAQGLFALRPAPVQLLHQEYLGTSGAQYVDYLFTDMVTSPPKTDHLYTEKLIYLPNHFFSKGHAFQSEVKDPTYEYAPKRVPFELGTGSPQENKCLSGNSVGDASFVFCNFNKLLKANPETIRSWIRILREVPGSMLCLLENPKSAIPYVRRFVHEATGTSKRNGDPASFVAGDGDDINARIHFVPWENNPFDYQLRNQDLCNVMLDSYPYNGHTVAQDSLYAGVPIVTRSDGDDMSSRVTTSANIVLGLEELNAVHGPEEYENIAIRLATDADFFQRIRTKLIDSCLQRDPMHPYWDVARYVKNFETGLKQAWDTFMNGREPENIFVEESEETQKGTFSAEIEAHPQDGRRNQIKSSPNDEL